MILPNNDVVCISDLEDDVKALDLPLDGEYPVEFLPVPKPQPTVLHVGGYGEGFMASHMRLGSVVVAPVGCTI